MVLNAFTRAIGYVVPARHPSCFSKQRLFLTALAECTLRTRLKLNVTKREVYQSVYNETWKQIKSFKPSPSSCSLTEKGPTAREYVLEPESYPFSSNDRLLLPFPPAGGVVQLLQRSSQMEPFPLLRQTMTSQKKKTKLLAELSIRKALRWKSWTGEVESHW